MSSLNPPFQDIAIYPESGNFTRYLDSSCTNWTCSQFSNNSRHLVLRSDTFQFIPIVPLVPHARNISPTSEFRENDFKSNIY